MPADDNNFYVTFLYGEMMSWSLQLYWIKCKKKSSNLLSTLIKKSKQAYYDKCFERNWNNIKNTWKGIKSVISLKPVASSVPTVLSFDNSNTITSLYETANHF